jgi:MYXO-CTERM domain-containing protein
VAHPPDDPPPALLALLALLALVATVESPRCTMLVAEVEAAPVPLLNPLQ